MPPDENLDRLLRTSLREDFAEYAPDPTSALGELRHRTHGMERKPRRILPFLPGLPKTVIAVVCVVIVTAALLVVPRVFHIRAADTKPVTPAPVVVHSDFAIVSVPPELQRVFGRRFGPAFQLRGPSGKQVIGVLSYPNANAMGPGSAACGPSGAVSLGWDVWMTFSGDVSIISDPKTFTATEKESASEFSYMTLPTDHSRTIKRLVAWATVSMSGVKPSKETLVPVDVDFTFIGSNGTWSYGHLTPAQGYEFAADVRLAAQQVCHGPG